MAAAKNMLVLFAHGSPDPAWRSSFEAIAAGVARSVGEDRVRLAYMEFVGPTLHDVAAEAVANGITALRLLPLFMSSGGHVGKDIPAQAKDAMTRHPGLDIELLPPVGEIAAVRQAMVDAAIAAAD